MKLPIGKLLKGVAKIVAPLIVGALTTKAQREIEKQAEKLIKKTDKI